MTDSGSNPQLEAMLNLFGLVTDLTVSVDTLAKRMKDDLDRRQKQMATDPLPRNLVQTVTLAAAGSAQVLMGKPANGRIWTVRSFIAVNAAAVGVALTDVNAAFYRASTPSTVQPSNLLWPMSAVPAAQNFTSNVKQVIPGDSLIGQVTAIVGATFPLTVVLLADVIDEKLAVKAENVIEI
jgi:hypothetical protein